ncbi:MAG: hypothetical protein FJ387_12425 [Verrucomicrobia bacterium]|nr:hypothetical protein [Verrucomicrobiota bacterium]
MRPYAIVGWGRVVRRGRRGLGVLTGSRVRAASVAVVALLVCGCKRSPTAVPASPPEAIETVITGLTDNQPQVLWHALPSSYQQDLREVISAFCASMDPQIYDRAFRILGKAVQVMSKKEEFIFNSPIMLSTPFIESSMGARWNETVALLDTIATSDLSTLESLSRIDPGAFLASTGHKVMEGMENLSLSTTRSPGQNPWDRARQALEQARIEFQPGTNGLGLLRWSSAATDAVREVTMTAVEGRWLPADMAAAWHDRVEQAKEGLKKLGGPEFEKAKPMLHLALGALEGAMDSLLQARNQQEFDTTLRSLATIAAMIPSPKKPAD